MDDKAEKPSSFVSKNEQEHIETFTTASKEAPFVPSKEEKKLVKKLNWTFMPYVCVLVFIQVCLDFSPLFKLHYNKLRYIPIFYSVS